MPYRKMPLGLQKYTIKKIFRKWNPSAEPNDLNWEYIQGWSDFEMNFEIMRGTNTQYVWQDPEHKRLIKERNRQIQEKRDELKLLYAIGSDDGAYRLEREIKALERIPIQQPRRVNWKVENRIREEVYSTTVEIKPHKVMRNGKSYSFGRIQVLCDASLKGLKAEVTVIKPKGEHV